MPAVKIDDRSTLTTLIGLDGYANKPKALRSANKHEIRRGHQ